MQFRASIDGSAWQACRPSFARPRYPELRRDEPPRLTPSLDSSRESATPDLVRRIRATVAEETNRICAKRRHDPRSGQTRHCGSINYGKDIDLVRSPMIVVVSKTPRSIQLLAPNRDMVLQDGPPEVRDLPYRPARLHTETRIPRMRAP